MSKHLKFDDKRTICGIALDALDYEIASIVEIPEDADCEWCLAIEKDMEQRLETPTKSIKADLKALEVPKMVVWVDGETKIETTHLTEKTIAEIMSLFKVYSHPHIDPFNFVESCEPDCSPERHAYHQGQWDMAGRINQFWGLSPHPTEHMDCKADLRGAETGVENGDL